MKRREIKDAGEASPTWTRAGFPLRSEDGERVLLSCLRVDIWYDDSPDVPDPDQIPLRRADSFGADAVVGTVVAFRPATPLAERFEPDHYACIGNVVPGYIAIRNGDWYVARMLLDPAEPHPGDVAAIRADDPHLLS